MPTRGHSQLGYCCQVLHVPIPIYFCLLWTFHTSLHKSSGGATSVAALVQPFAGGGRGELCVLESEQANSITCCSRRRWIECQWKEWEKSDIQEWQQARKKMHCNTEFSSQMLTLLRCFYFLDHLLLLGPNWRGTLLKKKTTTTKQTCKYIILSQFKTHSVWPFWDICARAAGCPLLLAAWLLTAVGCVVPSWCPLLSQAHLQIHCYGENLFPHSLHILTHPPLPASLSAEMSSTGLPELWMFYPNCCRRIGDETTYALQSRVIYLLSSMWGSLGGWGCLEVLNVW